MQRYKNLSGQSGVTHFALAPGSIVVQFDGGSQYEYTVASAGAAAIATMHRLATSGRGLSTFIATEVRDHYARKLR